MELIKPNPLIIDGVPHYTLTSYDPVSVEVDVPSATEADIDQALQMTIAEQGGTAASMYDDAWIREHFEGVGNVRELRDALREQVSYFNEQYAEEQKVAKCGIELAMRLVQRVPDDRVAAARAELEQVFAMSLQHDGISAEELYARTGMRRDEMDRMLDLRARGAAETDAALGAWVEHFKITVTDDEIPGLLGYGPDGSQFLDQLRAAGQLEEARMAACRSKAMQQVVTECHCTYHHETGSGPQGNSHLKLV